MFLNCRLRRSVKFKQFIVLTALSQLITPMTLLLALLRQHQPTLLLQQQTARCLAGAVCSQDAVSTTVQRVLCTCSNAGASSSSATLAGWQQQVLQQHQQQQLWQQWHAANCSQQVNLQQLWPGQWSTRRTFLSAFTQPDNKAYKERRLIG
jgi:hypothetical protein